MMTIEYEKLQKWLFRFMKEMSIFPHWLKIIYFNINPNNDVYNHIREWDSVEKLADTFANGKGFTFTNFLGEPTYLSLRVRTTQKAIEVRYLPLFLIWLAATYLPRYMPLTKHRFPKTKQRERKACIQIILQNGATTREQRFNLKHPYLAYAKAKLMKRNETPHL